MEKVLEEVLQLIKDSVTNRVNLVEMSNNRSVKVVFEDDLIKIQSTIKMTDEKDKLVEDFKRWMNSIDQDLFLEICESFEPGALNKLDKVMHTDDVESIKKGIENFKVRAKKEIQKKIKELNALL